MSISMRALIVLVATLLFAAPVLANADFAVGNADAGRSVIVLADNDVDCSKIDDDDAREKCREKKVDRRSDDVDVDGVDCSKIDDDDAREECRERKVERRRD